MAEQQFRQAFMRRPVYIILATSLILSGCGNWFGGGRSAPTEASAGSTNPLLPAQRNSILSRPEPEDVSVLVDVVREIRVERAINGAIVTATGVAGRQGAFGAELRPENDPLGPDANGVLNFSFRVIYPERPRPVGTERTRTLTAAYSLSEDDLTGVRAIRVSGRQNAQESRRN